MWAWCYDTESGVSINTGRWIKYSDSKYSIRIPVEQATIWNIVSCSGWHATRGRAGDTKKHTDRCDDRGTNWCSGWHASRGGGRDTRRYTGRCKGRGTTSCSGWHGSRGRGWDTVRDTKDMKAENTGRGAGWHAGKRWRPRHLVTNKVK